MRRCVDEIQFVSNSIQERLNATVVTGTHHTEGYFDIIYSGSFFNNTRIRPPFSMPVRLSVYTHVRT